LHHAYLLLGDTVGALDRLALTLRDINFVREGNPDYFSYDFEVFGIDDARRITELAERSPFGERKVFFISSSRITREAQNALLKILEEPVSNTHFFLSVREEEMIIPTLISRMEIIRVLKSHEGDQKEAKKFINHSLRERLDFAQKFSDGEINLPEFLDDLLLELRSKSEKAKVEKVFEISKYAGETSSPRLILEYCALIV